MRRVAFALAMAACGGKPSPSGRATEEPVGGTTAAEPPRPVERTDEIAPPAECGKRTWRQCLDAAESLVTQTPAYQEQGVELYKLLCAEGDRRRCFEKDGAPELRTRCDEDGLLRACYDLALLYRDGVATCPDDDTCADLLLLMTCHGGMTSTCFD